MFKNISDKNGQIAWEGYLKKSLHTGIYKLKSIARFITTQGILDLLYIWKTVNELCVIICNIWITNYVCENMKPNL